MAEDIFSDSQDRAKIQAQFIQLEFYRDFIIWLCEEELDSTVTEMEEKYNKTIEL